jgi:actin-related protein
MQRSVVEDWEQLEVVLHHTLYELLGWEFENEGGLMMAEPMFTSRKSRETMTQVRPARQP